MTVSFRFMKMIAFVVFFSVLGFSCSIFEPESGWGSRETLYRTPLVDYAHGAAVLPNGDFLVYGYTEGRIGSGEWNNAFPLQLFMRANGSIADTVVYRNIRYGEVLGAAPFGNGVAVLVDSVLRVRGSEPNSLRIHLLQADHSLGKVLFSVEDVFTPIHPLVATADNGLLLAFFPRHRADDGLIKINAAGEIAWTYDRVGYVDVTEDGDILVLGDRNNDQFAVARLSPDGQVRWQKNYGGAGSVVVIAAVQDGATVLGHGIVSTLRTNVLTKIDRDGKLLWQRSYNESMFPSEALTALPDGGFVFGRSKLEKTDRRDYGGEAEIVRLNPEGDVLWRHPFGPAEATTFIVRILVLPDKQIAVVGSTGPKHYQGVSGADFDILIMLLDDK